MPSVQEDLRQNLAAAGQRWTKSRETILGVLQEKALPMSAKDLYAAVSSKGINLASVYRAVELFVREGVVAQVDSPDGIRRYELSDRYRPHHHHVVCRECGSTRDIPGCVLGGLGKKAEKLTGFKILTHQFSLTGLCPRCT